MKNSFDEAISSTDRKYSPPNLDTLQPTTNEKESELPKASNKMQRFYRESMKMLPAFTSKEDTKYKDTSLTLEDNQITTVNRTIPLDQSMIENQDNSVMKLERDNNFTFKNQISSEKFKSLLKSDSSISIADKLHMDDEEIEAVEIKKPKKQRCVCTGNGNMRIKWDVFIIILAVWNGLSIPYSVAFYHNGESSATLFSLINYILDF